MWLRSAPLALLVLVAAYDGRRAHAGEEGEPPLDKPEEVVTFTLKSGAFADGAPIPRKHTCQGADVSPPLSWSGAPDGTKAFALVVDDPDAPAGTWVHWVLWGLPASARALDEGVPGKRRLDDGAAQGKNDFGEIGWRGPGPPPGGPHRYDFKLRALDAAPELEPGATEAELREAVEGHVLATAKLMGRYGRASK